MATSGKGMIDISNDKPIIELIIDCVVPPLSDDTF